MTDNNYGFVYIWFDKKYKQFYIGCHWGFEGDGYICSSRWMRNAYKRRTNDFKRRVVTRIYTNRIDLLKEEHRWLSMIKDGELGVRYYNLSKHHFGHWASVGTTMKATIRKKMKIAWTPERRRKASVTMSKTMNNVFNDPKFKQRKTAHMKQLADALWSDPGHRAKMLDSARNVMAKNWENEEFRSIWQSPEFKKKKSAHMKSQWASTAFKQKQLGAMHNSVSAEGIARRSQIMKQKWADPGFREKMSQKYKTLWQTPEYKDKMRLRRRPDRDPVSGQFIAS